MLLLEVTSDDCCCVGSGVSRAVGPEVADAVAVVVAVVLAIELRILQHRYQRRAF